MLVNNKKGEIISILLFILFIWAFWKFICKPVYHFFTREKTAIEQIDEKRDPDFSSTFSKIKHPIKYTKTLLRDEEAEKKAKEKIDICNSLLNSKDYDNALIMCDEALDKTTDNDKMSDAHQLRGKIFQAKNNYDDARKEFLIASRLSKTQQQKRQNENFFENADNLFKDSFLQKEYNVRKLIIPIEHTEEIIPSHYISALKIDNMPRIKMPIGHPAPNQLYIAHPYITDKYVPFEDYEMDFLGERVREFCEFAQALGATEVTIESIQTKSDEETSSSKKDIKLDGKTSVAGGSIGNGNESTKYLLNTVLRGISISQKFKPSAKPFLPENLVWYNHEPSWQQLYRQRMRGGLKEHHENIESKKNRVIQNTEATQIKGELKAMLDSVGLKWDSSAEKKFNTKDDLEMTIYVKFAPLEELGNDNNNQTQNT